MGKLGWLPQTKTDGTADHSRVILAPDSDGRLSQVWIDTGKTNNPSAIKVDTSASTKSQ
jgi:hypothetical protein